MSAQTQTELLAQLQTELTTLREEMARLKATSSQLTHTIESQPVSANAVVPTHRRRLLRQLGAGMVAGLTATTIIAAQGGTAEARIGTAINTIGVLALPGNMVTANQPPHSFNTQYGVIGISERNSPNGFDLSKLPDENIGVYGYGNSTGVRGFGGFYGIYGEGVRGVYGSSGPFTTAYGVYGHGNAGGSVGVFAESVDYVALVANSGTTNQAQMKLVPKTTPGAPASTTYHPPEVGQLYMDSEGKLFVYTNIGGKPAWKQVQYVI